jgi:phage shock protein A
MKAKAQALDEMIDSGVLTDYTSNKNDIEGELEKMTVKSSADQELAKLKAERDKRQKKTTDPEETETEANEKQEQEVQNTA